MKQLIIEMSKSPLKDGYKTIINKERYDFLTSEAVIHAYVKET